MENYCLGVIIQAGFLSILKHIVQYQLLTIISIAITTVRDVHFYNIMAFIQVKVKKIQLSYDSNWMDLPYFVSSQETTFEVSLLKHFDA